jgi:hypothetical protein
MLSAICGSNACSQETTGNAPILYEMNNGRSTALHCQRILSRELMNYDLILVYTLTTTT